MDSGSQGSDATAEAVVRGGDAPQGASAGANGSRRPAPLSLLARFGRSILSLPLPLLTFASLWILAIKPDLRPWEPPPARSVTIGHIEVAEPMLALSEDQSDAAQAHLDFGPARQRFVSLVLVDARFIGYAQDDVRAWTVWIDAREHRRLTNTLQEHGYQNIDTVDEQATYWLDVDVPAPSARANSSGCFVIAVYLTVDRKWSYAPWSRGQPTPAAATPVASLAQAGHTVVVAHAITPAFGLAWSEDADPCVGVAGVPTATLAAGN